VINCGKLSVDIVAVRVGDVMSVSYPNAYSVLFSEQEAFITHPYQSGA
jgi:hypothetical protein